MDDWAERQKQGHRGKQKKGGKKLMNQKPLKKAGKTNADSSEIQHLCVFLSMYMCKDREDTKQ